MSNNEMPLGSSVFTVFLTMLFGANAVAMKFSLAGIGAFTNAGIRFGIAAIAIFLWAKLKKISIKLSSRQIKKMVPLCLIFVVQLSCFYNGLSRSTASHGTLISNVLPFVVLVLAHFFIPGDRITFKKGLGITLGFLGVMILFFDTHQISASAKIGDLIILMAVLLWGCNGVYLKTIIKDFNVIQVTLYPMIVGTPIFLIAGFFADESMIKYMNPTIITALLYQSLVTASFGFVAWNTLLQKFGATALHSFVFLMPVTGVLLGVLLLGEPVTLYLLLSILFIVTGIVIVNMNSKKQ